MHSHEDSAALWGCRLACWRPSDGRTPSPPHQEAEAWAPGGHCGTALPSRPPSPRGTRWSHIQGWKYLPSSSSGPWPPSEEARASGWLRNPTCPPSMDAEPSPGCVCHRHTPRQDTRQPGHVAQGAAQADAAELPDHTCLPCAAAPGGTRGPGAPGAARQWAGPEGGGVRRRGCSWPLRATSGPTQPPSAGEPPSTQ